MVPTTHIAGSSGEPPVLSPRVETAFGELFTSEERPEILRLAPWTKGAWTMAGGFRGWLEEPGHMPARLEGHWEPPELVGTCGRCDAFGPCIHLAALLAQVDSGGAFQRPTTPRPVAGTPAAPEVASVRTEVHAPRPRLLLAKWKVTAAGGKPVRVEGAVLHFGYGPREFREGDAATSTEWEREGSRVTCERDRVAESLLVRRLEELGLARRGPSPVRTFPDDAVPQWVDFLAETADVLREEGWAVECAPGWTLIWEEPSGWHGEWKAHPGGWFDLALQVEIEGKRHDLLALCRQILAGSQAESVLARLDQGKWVTVSLDGMLVRLPPERLRPILSALGFLLEIGRAHV